MKKIFTLLFIFASVMVMANPVDKKVAEKVALNHYTHFAPASIQDFTIRESFETVYEGTTTFYTFTFASGGFVMVAADDASLPVLGYSYEGQLSAEAENPSAKAWFETYNRQLAEIAGSKFSNAETRPLWDNILTNNMERSVLDVGQLLTTTWDQGCYYNALCPVENGAGFGSCNHAWTGCVATTMAQIMKYHAFPETGLGYRSYTHADYGLQTANFGGTTYNYAAMPNNVTSANTAVATLMYHAGVSVNMNYAADGSGAFSQDVPFALINYFNYAPTTVLKSKADYPVMADWWAILRTELDASRPIYYSGSSTASGGHAWVCDGYRTSDNKFHFNWGWSGSYNGYFAIGALNPGGNNFNDENTVVVGIQPGDNPATWIAQNSGFAAASRGISYMHAPSATVAWATAYDGSGTATTINEFTRTTNGGELWTSGQVLGGTTYGLGNICALDATKAYVAVYKGEGNQDNTCGVYKTSNGGTTWTQLPGALQGAASFANNVYFWNEQEGMCHGDVKDGYFEIYTTINGGTSWQRVPQTSITGGPPASGEGGWTSVIEATGDNTIMFGTNKGKVYISDDRGFTWRVSSTGITPATNGGINMIAFSDPDNGIVGQTLAPVTYKRTTNGGITWETLTPAGPFLSSDLMAVPGSPNTYVSTGAAAGFTGVSYSTDGGLNWTYFGGTSDRQFLAGDFFDNTCGYAGGFNTDQNNDGMYRMIGELGAAAVGPQISVNPLEFSLSVDIDEIVTNPLTISNTGDASLDWTILIDPVTATWLSVSPASGTTPAGGTSELTVTFDATGLVPDIYNAFIVVNNNSAANPVVNIPVHMTVMGVVINPPTNLQATVDLYDVHLTWNAPEGTRELLGYNIYRDGVKINGAAVSELMYDDNGLSPGTYEYHVRALYTDGESVNSNAAVAEIYGGPQISVNPLEFSLSVDIEEIVTNPLSISNTGDASLDWTILIDPGTAAWLSVSPASGSTPAGGTSELTVTFDATGLVPDIYNAFIVVNNNSAANPVVNIPVQMTVMGIIINPPTNLLATVDLDIVHLTWNAPELTREMLGYNVYRNSVVIAELVAGTIYNDMDLQNGNYTYSVTAVYDFGESIHSNIVEVEITGVGIEDNELNSQLSIYPNPAGNSLNVKTTSDIISVKLFNPAGQQVFESSGNAPKMQINTSDIPSGLYLLIISTKQNVMIRKISIQ